MKPYAEQQRRTLITSILFFFLLALGIIAIGADYYNNFELQSRAEAEMQLSAFANSKMDELTDWRSDLLDRAKFIYKNQSFTDSTAFYMKDRQNVEAREHIRNWLEAYQKYDEFDRIYLLDGEGAKILSYPEKTPRPVFDLTKKIPEALQTKKITFIDFYRDEEDQQVYLAILVPVIDERQSQRVIGFILLRVNPQVRLYPYLAQKVTGIVTAEAFLIRREGEAAVFLTPLKFNPDAPLNLNTPADKKKNIEVMAALGQTGVREGVDYRGVAMVSFIQPVPDTPWVLVVHEDVSEVNLPVRDYFFGTIIVTGTIIFYSGLGLVLIWRQRQLRHYQSEAEAAETLRKTEDQLRRLTHELDDKVRERTAELENVNQKLLEEKQRAELLVEDIKENREQLRALSLQMVDLQEKQIKTLARELHDSIGQNLTAININLSLVRQILPKRSAGDIKLRLADTSHLVEETVARMRNVIADFLPPMLESYGLASALLWYGEQFSSRTNIEVKVNDGRGDLARLSPEVEIGLFRIVQEALNNVAKHAHASHVVIEMANDGDNLLMTISDDGAGFDPQVVFAKPAHWGFAIMRERARALDASFDVWSAPGEGTKILLRIVR